MNFKSKNWEHIQHQKIKSRVAYFESDLLFSNSGKQFSNRPTTVVVLFNGNDRYVGVSQFGPKGMYRKDMGREIAAGRALKQMQDHLANPDKNANDVWSFNGEEVIVYGDIPAEIEDDIPNGVIFGGSEQPQP